jgi:hypothetical protein
MPNKGYKISEEHRKNLRLAHIGQKSWNTGKGGTYHWTDEQRANLKAMRKKGSENHSWKGKEISYTSLHGWVRKELGIPKECVYCGRRELKRKDGRNAIQYANVSRKYKRVLNDWIPLCSLCHGIYDRGNRRNLI